MKTTAYWMMLALIAACLGMAGCCGECTECDDHEHGTDGAAPARETGPNGGELVEKAECGLFVEIVHDGEKGRLDLYVLDVDGSTPFADEASLYVNVQTDAGPMKLETTAADDAQHFFVEHDILTGDHVHGEIGILASGKECFAPICDHGEH